MRLRAKLQRVLLVLAVGVVVMLSQRGGTDVPHSPNRAVDYFPINRDIVWTFTTNIAALRGIPESIFEVKIDTATYQIGENNHVVFMWYFYRRPSSAKERNCDFVSWPDPNSSSSPQRWRHFFVLKDSASALFSWGDYPDLSRQPDALGWKHVYEPSEGTRETINIQGKIYNTVRIDMTTEDGIPISWWFADGIGLVKEYSPKGGSIFTDDYLGSNLIMNTELLSYIK